MKEMGNITSEELTTWTTSIGNSLDEFINSIYTMSSNSLSISNIVESQDMSLSNSWRSLSDTLTDSANTLKEHRNVLEDTIKTFVASVEDLHSTAVETVNLADNAFKGFVEAINAI